MSDKIIHVTFGVTDRREEKEDYIHEGCDDMNMSGSELRTVLHDAKTGKRFRIKSICTGTMFID